jgi:hypothetical protein
MTGGAEMPAFLSAASLIGGAMQPCLFGRPWLA